MGAEFLGLTANGWTAVGTMMLAVATTFLVGVGWYQLHQLREENKKSRTLQVCERYDIDPVLDTCLRNLAKAHASGDLEKNPEAYRIDCATLLNYLETLCCGVEAGIYDATIVQQFHKETIRDQFTDYIDSGLVERMKMEGEYDSLLRVCREWKIARS